MSFNAHVERLHQFDLHWIQAGVHSTAEAVVRVNFKGVTERAEAGFGEDVVGFMVDVVAGDTGQFGILAGEAKLDLVASGDYRIGGLKGVDLVFKDHEVSRVLIGKIKVYHHTGTLSASSKKKFKHSKLAYLDCSAAGVE